MNRILDEQQRRNRASRDAWQRYREHREHVTQLLQSVATNTQVANANGRLCVLGAGNCNDLDLAILAKHFREIELVDWDAEALAAGVEQQSLASADRDQIRLSGGLDFTGIGEALNRWAPNTPPSHDDVGSLIQSVQQREKIEPNDRAQVTISICTLTQLVDAVAQSVGAQHARFFELVAAVRARHLRTLVERTTPGGTAILCTDTVSSDTFPALPQIPLNQLAGALSLQIQQRNFFTGVNPFVLEDLFRSDTELAAHVADAKLQLPWRWDFGPRIFAVCAIVAHVRPDA